MSKCAVCGEPTWVWHHRGEDYKHGHCDTCGAMWLMMDEGELDIGIVHAEAKPRNDISFFMEEWTEITEMGASWEVDE
jgi:hypothetical protein